ncbi:MAG: hypothetical protein KAI24_13115 [Planctomycetes bacterium]|nr:hypothetical protein [Planctomycetota bacterium]
MTYVPPERVTAPQDHWELGHVVLDDGPSGIAVALGTWDGKAVLAARWNGEDEAGSTLGNPQSRGKPTWFVLPRVFALGVVQAIAQLHVGGYDGIDATGLTAAVGWLRRESLLPRDLYDEE